jgi:hypothetical protein
MHCHRARHDITAGLLSLLLGSAILVVVATSARSDEPAPVAAQGRAVQDRFINNPFIRDTTLDWHIRTYYLGRDDFDGSKAQAWAGGGWLAYKSGLLAGTFHIGATLNTSQPIFAPSDQGGTLLLTNDQEALNALSEAYLGAMFFGQGIVVGRQLIDTPLINRNDTRMIPMTFEGVTLRSDTGKNGRFQYIAGYIQRFRPRDSNDFESISQGFGVDALDTGTPFAWFAFHPNDQLSLAAMNYWVEDVINTGYVESIYRLPRRGFGPQFILAANLITQHSVGSDLLTGSSFSTYQGSARVTADFGDLQLTAVGSTTGTGAAINFPLGNRPNYTDLQQASFERAGEDAAGVGATLRLSKLGLKDVTAAAWHVWGWDAIDAFTGASLPNRRELDLSLRYQPSEGHFKGLSVWARYGEVFSRGAGVRDDQPEFRFIVDYTVHLIGP